MENRKSMKDRIYKIQIINNNFITITNYNIQNKITSTISIVKKHPKKLVMLEIVLGMIFFLYGENSSFDFMPSEQLDVEVRSLSTIPVLISTMGPMEVNEFEGGSSISMGIGTTYVEHLPTIDGLNPITPDGLEFSSMKKIEKPLIDLDQKSYTWGERVDITIIDPFRNFNENSIDKIGSFNDNELIIATKGSDQKLDYILEETGLNTNLFSGSVFLTGFQGHDANNDGVVNDMEGISFGHGPFNGKLATIQEDEIIISYKYDAGEVVSASAPIKWNIGEINLWYDTSSPDNKPTIWVFDPDLNLHPYGDDFVLVHIKSDNDPEGIDLILEERNYGFYYEGEVEISSEKEFGKLKALEGDLLTAIYYDRTLPNPYNEQDVLEIRDSLSLK